MESMWKSSIFDGGNAAYLESLYEVYLENPNQLSVEWQQYFANLPIQDKAQDVSHQAVKEAFRHLTQMRALPVSAEGDAHAFKQMQVMRLVAAYRLQGHLHAQIDPLGMRERLDENDSELTLEEYGLSTQDMQTVFNIHQAMGVEQMQLGALYLALNDTYCGSIGTEYMHIPSRVEQTWIQERIEKARATPQFSNEKKTHILERLTAAEGLEKYLGVKFPGAKRFSLEGAEALLPLLDELVQRAGEQNVRECIIGMAHRGRLNVLVNLLGKDPHKLFSEFEGRHESYLTSGDVKYHQGFSSDMRIGASARNIHLALAFNPSHLEIVTPVVAGSVCARQNRSHDDDHNKVVPIAIHGDAAFAGQGVVMETLNMSQTRGYGIGGTIHIVVNNQVGFTTSNLHDARSTLYCSDVAKVVLAPIFHVNADDPEAVVLAAQFALDYRMRFNKDVVIDLVCYRRHGHNEADDPFATQPVMYNKIKQHPTVRQLYANRLVQQTVFSQAQVDALVKHNRALLDKGEGVAYNILKTQKTTFVDWQQYHSSDWNEAVETAISKAELLRLSERLQTFPEGFHLHPRVAKIYEEREKMAQGVLPIDWGFAETMAYAALLEAGFRVRLSGQDCGRGTFFHRHAVLHDQKTGAVYTPLEHIAENGHRFKVIDSLLSEEAVLAFEYGYATADPTALVIWEAQFGDFANGAQVVIDQFISSGEQKWERLCGLVMLLPHGYEGQGPEHSSARLERFLQLCAQHNMQVCVPTTAAQVFHMLRRQMLRKLRTPLVVMSPKSLLRHKGAACDVSALMEGTFQLIIGETQPIDAKQVTKVVLCSGKVYYDLIEKREKLKAKHVAILRIEQLYPFPEAELKKALKQYPHAQSIVWCQEEPKNQGAWFSSQHHFRACLSSQQQLSFAGREASASPAVGYARVHIEQQEALVEAALK